MEKKFRYYDDDSSVYMNIFVELIISEKMELLIYRKSFKIVVLFLDAAVNKILRMSDF